MRIVLSGALPETHQARELTPYLIENAPTLARWFERSRATRIVADPAQTWCTAWEYWHLLEHRFTPRASQIAAAGLGPILGSHAAHNDQPIWLIELVHLSPSRDGAVLIPAKDLAITADQSASLFQTAQKLFTDTGFGLYPCTPTHWLITLPQGYEPSCPSPELVSISTVNEWWRQDIEGRPWRRLANELQMSWFDHPVNQQRTVNGEPPINGVWLFGGASRSQISKPASTTTETRMITTLSQPMLTQDWGTWLAELKQLEVNVFARLHDAQPDLVLTGDKHIVTAVPDKRRWARLRPGIKNEWKKWWSPLN